MLGTLLLSMPISTNPGVSLSFIQVLFTAVSATSVTGLTVVDTALTWTPFGRAVILILIQIGGLGYMSVVTVFFFIMHQKIGLSQRLLLVQSLNLNDLRGVVQLVKHVLVGTLIFQSIGTLILWVRFMPDYGAWPALGLAVFHAVSAFCNAGFTILGGIEAYSSLAAYKDDAVLILTITALVFIGGIGFFVWEDLWRNKGPRNLQPYSKLVLSISAVLVLGGAVFFYLAERHNPYTLGEMSVPQAALTSFFLSAIPRSGGFSVMDQAHFRGVSTMFTMCLMMIGGSAGSAAGGIKNATVGILVLSAFASLRGRKRLSVFSRTIPSEQVIKAMSIALLAISIAVSSAVVISFIQPELPFTQVLFETTSAIGTSGLSKGITPYLSPASSLVIILAMFFGRVGIITLGMAAFIDRSTHEKIKYPDAWVMMG